MSLFFSHKPDKTVPDPVLGSYPDFNTIKYKLNIIILNSNK